MSERHVWKTWRCGIESFRWQTHCYSIQAILGLPCPCRLYLKCTLQTMSLFSRCPWILIRVRKLKQRLQFIQLHFQLKLEILAHREHQFFFLFWPWPPKEIQKSVYFFISFLSLLLTHQCFWLNRTYFTVCTWWEFSVMTWPERHCQCIPMKLSF